MQAFLFAQFNDNQNLWRVSYERLGAKTVDEAKGLSHVIDTQAYYQGLTADKTTSGLPSCHPTPQCMIADSSCESWSGVCIYVHAVCPSVTV